MWTFLVYHFLNVALYTALEASYVIEPPAERFANCHKKAVPE